MNSCVFLNFEPNEEFRAFVLETLEKFSRWAPSDGDVRLLFIAEGSGDYKATLRVVSKYLNLAVSEGARCTYEALDRVIGSASEQLDDWKIKRSHIHPMTGS